MSQNPAEDLKEIRKLMERSGKFTSVSGLSTITAGLLALIGALLAYHRLNGEIEIPLSIPELVVNGTFTFLLIDSLSVLSLSLIMGFIFTLRRASNEKHSVWTGPSQQLFRDFFITLGFGGLFCLALVLQNLASFLVPSMLIFYGLAMMNASYKTLVEVRFLGYTQLLLGGLNLFFLPYGFWFWCLGFGLVHLVYGSVIYFKYER